MIRYKVVDRDYKSCYAPPTYKKLYSIGTTVKARPKTLGIMCFKSLEDAKHFISLNSFGLDTWLKILKVKTYQRGTIPSLICSNYSDYYFKLFYSKNRSAITNFSEYLPSGTICYKKIEVLEIVKN